jgi:hypothetical protein
MSATLRTRRVLAACIASNAVFAGIGIATLAGHGAASALAAKAPANAVRLTTSTTAPALTPTSAAAPAVAAPTSSPTRSPSSRTSSRTPTMSGAAAVDDATGIASSAAPPTPSRIAPDAGSYPATFAGSASVNGRSQTFPSTGSMVFAASGSDLRQSSPNTPGNVVLTQRFSGGKSALVSFEMKAGDTSKEFRPASPVTFLVYNAPQGTAWNWSATSSDGATHVNATSTVGGTRVVNVGGQDVGTVEIITTLSLSGDMSGTAQLTVWASPTLRLPVMQRQVINAKASTGYGFSSKLVSDVTQTLTSLTAS